MEIIDVDGFKIGGEKTYIIAEIGSNFNQDYNLALESIEAAIESGANAVKFQSLNVDKLYFNPNDKIKALHKKIDFEEEWHYTLNDFCKKKNITFFSSPTYLESINILEEINVPLYKLASAQIGTFPQLVKKVASLKKPTLFSTGLTNIKELDNIVEIFKKENNNQYIILHCNSIYPAPYNKINLNLINFYQQRYNQIIGFSDHSDGITTSIGAVAKGAKVIEKHFAIDKSLPVPDAPFSLEPNEFKQMVDGIRIIDQALEERQRTVIETKESEFKNNILYKLVINKNLNKGDVLSQNDFNYLRCSNGIDCRKENEVIGKKINQNIKKNNVLEPNMLV